MQFSSPLWSTHSHTSHHEKEEKVKQQEPSHAIPLLHIQPVTEKLLNTDPSTPSLLPSSSSSSSTDNDNLIPPPSPVVPTPVVQLGKDIFKEPDEDPNEKDVISEIIPAQYTDRISKGGLYLTSFEMLKEPQNILNLPNVRLIVQCAEEYMGILQSARVLPSSSSSLSSSSLSATVPSVIILPSTIDVVELRMEDMVHYKIDQVVTSTVPLIASIRSKGGSVIINCAAGRSRSATMILFTLISTQDEGGEQMSLLQAFHHVRRIRPRACPNLGFVTQLMMYETSLHGECSIPVSTLRYHFDAKQLFDTVKEAEEYGQAAIDRGKVRYRERVLSIRSIHE